MSDWRCVEMCVDRQSPSRIVASHPVIPGIERRVRSVGILCGQRPIHVVCVSLDLHEKIALLGASAQSVLQFIAIMPDASDPLREFFGIRKLQAQKFHAR
jgi:hypothetical protein